MDYRRLGRSGLKVSCLCLGTMQWGWTTDEPTAWAVMDALSCDVDESGVRYRVRNSQRLWFHCGAFY